MIEQLTENLSISFDDVINDMVLESVEIQEVKDSSTEVLATVELEFSDCLQLDSCGFSTFQTYVIVRVIYNRHEESTTFDILNIRGMHEITELDFYKNNLKHNLNESFEINVY